MIYANNGGKITINGGTFNYTDTVWTLNLKDNSGSEIIVNGGTFVKFNPANNASEGEGTNFVAAEAMVKSGDKYTVYATLEEATEKAVAGDIIINVADLSETIVE